MSLLVALVVHVHTPQRDRSVPSGAQVGTASVSGTVWHGSDRTTPVRRAVISIIAADASDVRSAVTDDSGRYTVENLAAGRYWIRAEKPVYLTNLYGASRPGRPGAPVVIHENQQLAGLDVTLPRGGVLSGRIVLESGVPAAGLTVRAIPAVEREAGGTYLPSQAPFRTDDRGEFRIYGLAPGDYIVAAMPDSGGQAIQRRSETEVDLVLAKLKQPPAVSGATVEPENVHESPLVGFAPSYFPGTPLASEAGIVNVGLGDERTGVSFSFQPVALATLEGEVVRANGQSPASVVMVVEPVGPPMPLTATRSLRPTEQGRFVIPDLPPGVYHVRARAGATAAGGTNAINGANRPEWATAIVMVRGDAVRGVSLTLRDGYQLAGRFSTPAAVGPVVWTGARVRVIPIGRDNVMVFNDAQLAPRVAPVAADGTFVIEGIEPARYTIEVTPSASALRLGLRLSMIAHGEADLRDRPLTFEPGSITGVDVRFDTRATGLEGRITSVTGAPTAEYLIATFPADKTTWHPHSPRIQLTRPASDGAFRFEDLPPGAYRIVALTDVDDADLRNATFLESIYDASLPVTIEAGRMARQDVRIR